MMWMLKCQTAQGGRPRPRRLRLGGLVGIRSAFVQISIDNTLGNHTILSSLDTQLSCRFVPS